VVLFPTKRPPLLSKENNETIQQMNNTHTRLIQLATGILLVTLLGACQTTKTPNILHQIAPAAPLIQGAYDGHMSYAEVKQYGDFGLGTFDKIDGEMVALNGNFYQIKSDGTISEPLPTQTTPYASVHFFHTDTTHKISKTEDFDALKATLSALIEHKNLVYGIKIAATCTAITLRSPKTQTKPYPPLKDVIHDQSIFEKKDITGTLVGYYIPAYLGEVIVPGFHLHFISDDKNSGGHVLALKIKHGTVMLDELADVQIHLFGDGDKTNTAKQ
jgi:acetolactate decarboxylase